MDTFDKWRTKRGHLILIDSSAFIFLWHVRKFSCQPLTGIVLELAEEMIYYIKPPSVVYPGVFRFRGGEI